MNNTTDSSQMSINPQEPHAEYLKALVDILEKAGVRKYTAVNAGVSGWGYSQVERDIVSLFIPMDGSIGSRITEILDTFQNIGMSIGEMNSLLLKLVGATHLFVRNHEKERLRDVIENKFMSREQINEDAKLAFPNDFQTQTHYIAGMEAMKASCKNALGYHDDVLNNQQ